MKKTKTTRSPLSVHKHVRHHVKMAVVPHRANQFRPHVVRWYGLTVLAVLVGVLFFGSNLASTGSVLGTRATIGTTDLLRDTNVQRAHGHESPLKLNDELSRAAFMKAQDMFKQQYWAHVAPDGTTPWAWFAKVGYNYAYAGENLAKNFPSADATVAAWMASPMHRANILNTHYTDVGFAVVDGQLDGKQTTLVVALYGDPVASAQVAGVTTIPKTDAPLIGATSVMTQFGMLLQSMTPATLSSVVLLLFGAVVALIAHTYRRQLPTAVRRSWKYHHGLYKAIGLTSFAIMIVGLYSGGQI